MYIMTNKGYQLQINKAIRVVKEFVAQIDPNADCGIYSVDKGYLYVSPAREKRAGLGGGVLGKKWYEVLKARANSLENGTLNITHEIIKTHEQHMNKLCEGKGLYTKLMHGLFNNGARQIYGSRSNPILQTGSDAIAFNITHVLNFGEELKIWYKLFSKTKKHDKLVTQFYANNSNYTLKLNEREKQVLMLLALGQSSKEIANLLHKGDGETLSPNFINAIINQSLYSKFDVNSIGLLLEKAFNNDPHNIDSYQTALLGEFSQLILDVKILNLKLAA